MLIIIHFSSVFSNNHQIIIKSSLFLSLKLTNGSSSHRVRFCLYFCLYLYFCSFYIYFPFKLQLKNSYTILRICNNVNKNVLKKRKDNGFQGIFKSIFHFKIKYCILFISFSIQILKNI